ncbi:TetR/AcrR family transcriptional regulator [Desulfocurvus sp. DL9XJH121]
MNRDATGVRKRILETAYAKFSKLGVRGVTMDDIASDLRMSKKTLYRHFAGKEDLVRTLLMEKYLSRHEDIFKVLAQGGTIRELFARVFPLIGRYVQSLSPAFMADVQHEYPRVWELHEQSRSLMISRFARVLEAGVASGEVRPGIDPEVAAGIMQCVVTSYMVPDRFRDTEKTLPHAFLTWFSMFTGGMFQDPPDIQGMWDRDVAAHKAEAGAQD